MSKIGTYKDKKQVKKHINPNKAHMIKDNFKWEPGAVGLAGYAQQTEGIKTRVRSTLIVDGKPLTDQLDDTKFKKEGGGVLSASDIQVERDIDSRDTPIDFKVKFERTGEFEGVNRLDTLDFANNNEIKGWYNQLQKINIVRPPTIRKETEDIYLERNDKSGVPKKNSEGKFFNLGKFGITHAKITSNGNIDTSYNTKYRFGLNGESGYLRKTRVRGTQAGIPDQDDSVKNIINKNIIDITVDGGKYIFKKNANVITEFDVSSSPLVLFRINQSIYNIHPIFFSSMDWERPAGTDLSGNDLPINDGDYNYNVRYYNTNPIISDSWLKDDYLKYQDNWADITKDNGPQKDNSGLLFTDTSLNRYVNYLSKKISFLPLFDSSSLESIHKEGFQFGITTGDTYINVVPMGTPAESFVDNFSLKNIYQKDTGTNIVFDPAGPDILLNEHSVLGISGNWSSDTANNYSISGWISNTFKGGSSFYLNRYVNRIFNDASNNKNKIISLDLSDNNEIIELYDLSTNNANTPYLVEIAKWSDLSLIQQEYNFEYFQTENELKSNTKSDDINDKLDENSWMSVYKGGNKFYFKNKPLTNYNNYKKLIKTGISLENLDELFVKSAIEQYDIEDLNNNWSLQAGDDTDPQEPQTYNTKTYTLHSSAPDSKYIYMALYVNSDISNSYKYHCRKHSGMTGNFNLKNLPYFVNEYTSFVAEKDSSNKIEDDNIYFGNSDNYIKIKNPNKRYNINIKTEMRNNGGIRDDIKQYIHNSEDIPPDANNQYYEFKTSFENRLNVQTIEFLDKKFDNQVELDKYKKEIKHSSIIAPGHTAYDDNKQKYSVRNLGRTRNGQLLGMLSLNLTGARFNTMFTDANNGFGATGNRKLESNDIINDELKSANIKINNIFKNIDNNVNDLKRAGGVNVTEMTHGNYDTVSGGTNAFGLLEVINIRLEEMYETQATNTKKGIMTHDLFSKAGITSTGKTVNNAKRLYRSRDPFMQFKEKVKYNIIDNAIGNNHQSNMNNLNIQLDDSTNERNLKEAFANTFKAYKKPQILVDTSGTGTTEKTKLSAIINVNDLDTKNIINEVEMTIIDKGKWTNTGDISAGLVISDLDSKIKGLFIEMTTSPNDFGISKSETDPNLSDQLITKIGNPEFYVKIDKYDDSGNIVTDPIEYILTVPGLTAGKIPKIYALKSNMNPDDTDNWYNIDPNQASASEAQASGLDSRNIVRQISNQVYVKYYGSTTTSVGIGGDSTGAANADPYVEPLYGPRNARPVC